MGVESTAGTIAVLAIASPLIRLTIGCSSQAQELGRRGVLRQEERVTWTEVAAVRYHLLALPENRENLEEIVRQRQEASRLFNQARQVQRPVEEMVAEWGIPGN